MNLSWTTHAIRAALRALGRRPTPPAQPSAEYLAERARILGEART